MKPSLFKLALISGCALVAMPAIAQPAAPVRSAAATPPAKASVNAPKVLTAAASNKDVGLADGIVANATPAQIASPAPGFVYER